MYSHNILLHIYIIEVYIWGYFNILRHHKDLYCQIHQAGFHGSLVRLRFPKEPILFNASVYDNIVYGLESDEHVSKDYIQKCEEMCNWVYETHFF